ncbi:zinc ribbon domain-containing protein [Beduini massiliensis]|uniref:zinc ribbon domain-containing protein n=1 Tax=Beduini massiliensis TaxID=1585974 RepID=UPI00059A8702|nr:zinc ribbon domain-containing protein [Beduini massiliensis]
MFVIWGWGRKSKPTLYLGLKRCEREGTYQHFYVYRSYQHFSLFFIPFIQWSVKYYIGCSHCGMGMEIGKDQLPKCEALSRHLIGQKKVDEMLNYLRNQYHMMGHDEHTKEDLMERIALTYDIRDHEKEVEHMIEAVMEEDRTQKFTQIV